MTIRILAKREFRCMQGWQRTMNTVSAVPTQSETGDRRHGACVTAGCELCRNRCMEGKTGYEE